MVTLVFVALLLAAFGLDALVIRRLEAKAPGVRRYHSGETVELTVPRTVFFHTSHTWARLELDGRVTVGVDDLVRTLIDGLATVDLPAAGDRLRAGGAALTIHCGPRSVTLASPVSGRVVDVNRELGSDPARLRWQPYKEGWALRLVPDGRLAAELASLAVGDDAKRWMEAEAQRVDGLFERGLLKAPADGALDRAEADGWSAFASEIVGSGKSSGRPVA